MPKISDLPEDVAPDGADLIAIVDVSASRTEKVTLTDLFAALGGGGTGTVDTSGTPVATDFARFTDADTIEGRSPSEVRADLDLEPGVDIPAMSVAPVSVAGATDTLASGDNGKVNIYTEATLVTVTLPTDASDDLADGFECLLVAAGAAGLTLSTTGITLIGSSPNKTIAQNEGLFVKKTATANTWLILGGTAA